jgi:cobalt/nickel transport system permease protein
MHIADGFLPAEVCIGGYLTTAALTAASLRQINRQHNPQEGIPTASLLAAAFFVVSWIHIPIPPSSVHLVLNGLLGAVLGYYAMPAILVALFFQAIMFGHGGLTTLGVNATMMGVPALLAWLIFRAGTRVGVRPTTQPGQTGRLRLAISAFLAGASGLGLAALIFFTLLVTTIPATVNAEQERAAITAAVIAYLPLMVIEGVFTAMVIIFLQQVRPELLQVVPLPPRAYERQP